MLYELSDETRGTLELYVILARDIFAEHCKQHVEGGTAAFAPEFARIEAALAALHSPLKEQSKGEEKCSI